RLSCDNFGFFNIWRTPGDNTADQPLDCTNPCQRLTVILRKSVDKFFVMPAKCSLCSSGINRGNPGISCQGKCRSSFDPKYLGLPATCADLSDDSGFGWTCKQCRSIPNNNIPALEMGELITKMDMLLKDMILVKARQTEF
ncbi:hypothetical protein WA026_006787, partial [Henosepilachna vigintioctopunctata]